MLVAVIALVACSGGKDGEAPPPDPGSISLSWTIGASGCTDAAVDAVAVVLDDGSGVPGDELGSFACTAGEGTVDADPGTLDLLVRGRDTAGVDRYGASVGDVQVVSGQATALGDVLLSALPASLTVNWHFENGYLCAQNDAATVSVNLFDDGDSLVQNADTDCDDGLMVLDGVTAGGYTVDVQGKDDAGNVGWQGEAPVTLEKGAPTSVNVELAATN